MKFVVVTLLIVVAFFQESKLQNEYGLVSPFQPYAGASDSVNCTGIAGSICSAEVADCGSMFLCIPNMPDPIKASCETGLTCNAGSCSVVKSPLCEYGSRQFICNTEGMYPDPSSCKKFNYCVPGTETTLALTEATCDAGWGYNSVTTSCDKRLLNNNCPAMDRLVPPCSTVGQNGPLRSNPKMYYICMPYSVTDLELYPYIFKCPKNTRYAGKYNCT